MAKSGKYQAVVIGVSAGGIGALEQILPVLAADYGLPVLIVQHMAAEGGEYLIEHFSSCCRIAVREAMDKEKILPATVYFAPANYHLLVEKDRTMALSIESKVNFSRPSVDVLFETAAEVYCNTLVGVVLTGANADGAAGLARIKEFGGLCIAQSPKSAEIDIMPKAAIRAVDVDHILMLEEIGPFLASLDEN